MSLKALLFDLDGTLVNTDPVHMAVFAEILAPLGHVVDEAFFRQQISGHRNEEIFRKFFPDLDAEEIQRMGREKEDQFRAGAQGVKPVVGLERVLTWATDNGLAIGLVTNAPRANVDFILPLLGVENVFGCRILADEMGKGKPDPAPYRAALETFGINAREAVVFEDSGNGIRSSVGAGIFTYGLKTTHSEQELSAAGADLAIADYNDPVLWEDLIARFYAS